MNSQLKKIATMVRKLGYSVDHHDDDEDLLVVTAQSKNIHNLILDCEDSSLILELPLSALPKTNREGVYEVLLKLNRQLAYGCFALNRDGDKLIWRDTLALENLDDNELEASMESVSQAFGLFHKHIKEQG